MAVLKVCFGACHCLCCERDMFILHLRRTLVYISPVFTLLRRVMDWEPAVLHTKLKMCLYFCKAQRWIKIMCSKTECTYLTETRTWPCAACSVILLLLSFQAIMNEGWTICQKKKFLLFFWPRLWFIFIDTLVYTYISLNTGEKKKNCVNWTHFKDQIFNNEYM